jgi:hypothetical protein
VVAAAGEWLRVVGILTPVLELGGQSGIGAGYRFIWGVTVEEVYRSDTGWLASEPEALALAPVATVGYTDGRSLRTL